MPVNFINSTYCENLNIEFLFAKSFLVVFGNDYLFETQFFGFGNPLFNAVNCPDLST